jgi:hypothetical protein
MSGHEHAIAEFRGGVSCRPEAGTPLGLTLVGRSANPPEEGISVAFSGPAPEGLPEALEDAWVERASENTYRIASGTREWIVSATAVHVHRDVSTVFYRAVAPRTPGVMKRIFWSLVLTVAHNPTGKRLLLALRRR